MTSDSADVSISSQIPQKDNFLVVASSKMRQMT